MTTAPHAAVEGSDRVVPPRRAAARVAPPPDSPPANPWPLLPILTATLALSVLAEGGGTLPGDTAVARWLQTVPERVADPVARFAHWIGSLPPLTAAAAGLALALLWLRRHPEATFLLAAALLRRLNPDLKDLLDSPRPTAAAVRVTEQADGLGYPSGHAMGVALVYGAVLLLAPRLIAARPARRLVQAGAALVVLATGFGRVYTGAHWPSDVLGGYLWAATVLLLLAAAWRAAGAVARRRQAQTRLPRP